MLFRQIVAGEFTQAEDALVRRYARGELSIGHLRRLTGRSQFSLRSRLATLGERRAGPRSLSTVEWQVLGTRIG